MSNHALTTQSKLNISYLFRVLSCAEYENNKMNAFHSRNKQRVQVLTFKRSALALVCVPERV
jgi:hypothetical protein